MNFYPYFPHLADFGDIRHRSSACKIPWSSCEVRESRCRKSEDYYGDLDLKSIRKSELLAGLNNSQGRSSPPAAAPNKPTKPRPQNNQNRPSPPPSQGEA